ncbi:MAG TPA: 4'-phosphopantetheinyl transferase superfamily protein [Micromonosporaceae bacterium]
MTAATSTLTRAVPVRRGRHVPPAPGVCHLWPVRIGLTEQWLDLLEPDELRHAERLPVEQARHTYVTSRAIQRLIGAHYLGVPPESVTVVRDCGYCGARHGRPRFAGATDRSVDYSVSHAGSWLIVAVVGTGRVGVDIEYAGRAAPGEDPTVATTHRDVDGLARHALTAAEHDRYTALPEPARAGWFFRAWTRKEAAMKVTGLGLRAAPSRLDVTGPVLAVDAVPQWPAGTIHLYDLGAPERYCCALAGTEPLRAVRVYDAGAVDGWPSDVRLRPSAE